MNSNERKKRIRERFLFDEFKRHGGPVPNGEVCQPDPPEPDIVITTTDKKIGIEITEYFYGVDRILKENEALQDRIVREALQIYEQEHQNRILRVRFDWDAYARINSRETSSLAKKLADIIIQLTPSPGSRIDIEQTDQQVCPLPPEIANLNIDRTIDYQINEWSSAMGGFIPSGSKEELDAIIVKKNKMGKKCVGKYDLLWLLIVADGGTPSSWCNLSSEAREHSFDSVFEVAIFFDRFTGQTTEINLL